MIPRVIFAVVLLVPSVSLEPAPFTQCNGNKTVKSRDIQVDVTECRGFAGRCPLYIGSKHDITVRFTPQEQIKGGAGIERLVMAIFAEKLDGEESAEIPYGPIVSANSNTVHIASGTSVEKEGKKFKLNEPYKHTSTFPVMAQAPKVNLTVRYVGREKITGPARRKSNWLMHPGQIFFCVEIPVELMALPGSG